jgi:hypothetical protein
LKKRKPERAPPPSGVGVGLGATGEEAELEGDYTNPLADGAESSDAPQSVDDRPDEVL